MTLTTPVLILAFIRPEMTLNLIQRIIDLGVIKIYISIDGPRNDREAEIQQLMRQKIEFLLSSHQMDWQIKQEIQNHGVKEGVLKGLDWFFQNENTGIVLEDDLAIDRYFLEFCNSYLPQIEISDEIWMISGMQVFGSFPVKPSPILSRYPMIWGWATTSKKWADIRKACYQISFLSPNQFGPQRAYFWNKGFQKVLKGDLDTWDLPLCLTFLLNKKYCLISNNNLASNIGFDESAAHTTENVFPLNLPLGDFDTNSVVAVNEIEYFNTYDKFLEKRVFKFRFIQKFLGYPYYFYLKFCFRKIHPSNWCR